MLTKNQLKQLRMQVVINSIFIKDYSNTLFINPDRVCNFFNSYVEYIEDLYIEKHGKIDGYWSLFDEYDNINTLYDYYTYLEYDPLVRDNYIAYHSLNGYESIVIYKIDNGLDDYALTGIIGGYSRNNKLTYNKIYYAANGDAYIKKFNRRYYLKNFTKKYNF